MNLNNQTNSTSQKRKWLSTFLKLWKQKRSGNTAYVFCEHKRKGKKNKHHTEPLIVRKINDFFFTVLLVGQKEKEVNKKYLL